MITALYIFTSSQCKRQRKSNSMCPKCKYISYRIVRRASTTCFPSFFVLVFSNFLFIIHKHTDGSAHVTLCSSQPPYIAHICVWIDTKRVQLVPTTRPVCLFAHKSWELQASHSIRVAIYMLTVWYSWARIDEYPSLWRLDIV